MSNQPNRVLITGAFGYLGGCLARYLAESLGHELLLGSRKPRDVPDWLHSGSVETTDWSSSETLEGACDGVDTIIHLSGMHAQGCMADPVAALEVNGLHTARLVTAAIRKGVQRIIYLSTAHVYGAPLGGTISEATPPLNLHPYATSHRAGEDAIRLADEHGDIEGVVIRLSNAFGAPLDKHANCWQLLVNDLCRQAVCDHRLTLHTTGMQYRDFIPMSDVVRSIAHVAFIPTSNLEWGVLNVGQGVAMRVIDMAETVRARCLTLFGYQPEILRPLDAGDNANVPLDYRIDRLLATGFTFTGDLHGEIDACLLACNRWWGDRGNG